jgi:hypothetical protein
LIDEQGLMTYLNVYYTFPQIPMGNVTDYL